LSFAVEETDLPPDLKAGQLLDFWEVGIGASNLLATDLAIQSAVLKENRGVYQLGLLVNATDVDAVIRAVASESFRLVIAF
jgi:hypothetical protein